MSINKVYAAIIKVTTYLSILLHFVCNSWNERRSINYKSLLNGEIESIQLVVQST